jgi:hypothetical protein
MTQQWNHSAKKTSNSPVAAGPASINMKICYTVLFNKISILLSLAKKPALCKKIILNFQQQWLKHAPGRIGSL